MGNAEGQEGCFPVAVCPHLGRTGLLTHKIRELEARQREEDGCPGGNGQTNTSPSSIPSLAHRSPADPAADSGVCPKAPPCLKTLANSPVWNETAKFLPQRGGSQRALNTPHPTGPRHSGLEMPFPSQPHQTLTLISNQLSGHLLYETCPQWPRLYPKPWPPHRG